MFQESADSRSDHFDTIDLDNDRELLLKSSNARTSPIWYFFTMLNNSRASCMACSKSIPRSNGSTGSMWKHLSHHHPQYFNLLRPQGSQQIDIEKIQMARQFLMSNTHSIRPIMQTQNAGIFHFNEQQQNGVPQNNSIKMNDKQKKKPLKPVASSAKVWGKNLYMPKNERDIGYWFTSLVSNDLISIQTILDSPMIRSQVDIRALKTKYAHMKFSDILKSVHRNVKKETEQQIAEMLSEYTKFTVGLEIIKFNDEAFLHISLHVDFRSISLGFCKFKIGMSYKQIQSILTKCLTSYGVDLQKDVICFITSDTDLGDIIKKYSTKLVQNCVSDTISKAVYQIFYDMDAYEDIGAFQIDGTNEDAFLDQDVQFEYPKVPKGKICGRFINAFLIKIRLFIEKVKANKELLMKNKRITALQRNIISHETVRRAKNSWFQLIRLLNTFNENTQMIGQFNHYQQIFNQQDISFVDGIYAILSSFFALLLQISKNRCNAFEVQEKISSLIKEVHESFTKKMEEYENSKMYNNLLQSLGRLLNTFLEEYSKRRSSMLIGMIKYLYARDDYTRFLNSGMLKNYMRDPTRDQIQQSIFNLLMEMRIFENGQPQTMQSGKKHAENKVQTGQNQMENQSQSNGNLDLSGDQQNETENKTKENEANAQLSRYVNKQVEPQNEEGISEQQKEDITRDNLRNNNIGVKKEMIQAFDRQQQSYYFQKQTAKPSFISIIHSQSQLEKLKQKLISKNQKQIQQSKQISSQRIATQQKLAKFGFPAKIDKKKNIPKLVQKETGVKSKTKNSIQKQQQMCIQSVKRFATYGDKSEAILYLQSQLSLVPTSVLQYRMPYSSYFEQLKSIRTKLSIQTLEAMVNLKAFFDKQKN